MQTINDPPTAWIGQLRLRVLQGPKVVSEQSQHATVPGYGGDRAFISISAPNNLGDYTLEAAIVADRQSPTRSLRDFKVALKAADEVVDMPPPISADPVPEPPPDTCAGQP